MTVCPACDGSRLNEQARNIFIGEGKSNKSIADIVNMPIDGCIEYFKLLNIEGSKAPVAKKLIEEISSRLEFLNRVGLAYLTLGRASNTLSGGESQRIRLASQIGSKLSGVMYVLDEPSIGMHQADNAKLIETLKALRDLGNSVIVVEHDEDTIRHADYIVDLGPGPGIEGGRICAAGTPEEIQKNPDSLTGAYLSGKLKVATGFPKKEPDGRF